ncbi:hypothetical protein [Mesorhizobium sp. ZC-5]|uniref:hypothetical protein n=1 Tax=Mesorhizobium sp. ZC-5 TaxID=2986066 RepID=UPI0021E75A94|nr:hypothetical protein [Mesorhizobium sp. ZC-5]MCV3239686.1 hypothetical protein [Mesorhizobium sp. ZC-5]
MVGILGFVYAIALILLGANNFTWWTIFIGAIGGTVLYLMMRPTIIMQDIQQGSAVGSLTMYYVAQVATAAILFGIGRAASQVF